VRDKPCSAAQIEPLIVNNYDWIEALKRLEGKNKIAALKAISVMTAALPHHGCFFSSTFKSA